MKTKLANCTAALILSGSIAFAGTLQTARHSPGAFVNRAIPGHEASHGRRAQATGFLAALDARLLARYNRLASRLDAARAAAAWNDFLFLQGAGYPIPFIDDSASSLESGILTVGTPSVLLSDYWGAPLFEQDTTVNGQSGQILTYQRPDGMFVRAVVIGGVVTQVLT
ncbi:MAG TPA: hypothetical protein VFD27_16255 [Chthoniobacteraceae bacterium]|nr:hypothetical protein [Chthoniobacteraceae bacterium]